MYILAEDKVLVFKGIMTGMEDGKKIEKSIYSHVTLLFGLESAAHLCLYDGAREIKLCLQTLRHVCRSCLRTGGSYIRISLQNLMRINSVSIIVSVQEQYRTGTGTSCFVQYDRKLTFRKEAWWYPPI